MNTIELELYNFILMNFSSTQDLRDFVNLKLNEISSSIVGGNASVSNLTHSIIECSQRMGLINELNHQVRNWRNK